MAKALVVSVSASIARYCVALQLYYVVVGLLPDLHRFGRLVSVLM